MAAAMNKKSDEISIVLSGEAGQGIQTIEQLITMIAGNSGYNVFSSPEFMSRIRGGNNTVEIRISSKRVAAFVQKIDFLIPLNKNSIKRVENRLGPGTILLGEKDNIISDYKGSNKIIDIPLTAMALETGNKIYANTIAVGIISGLLKFNNTIVTEVIKQYFLKKDEQIIQNNIKAVQKGYNKGRELLKTEKLEYEFIKNSAAKKELLLSGSEAVAMGALAGGCNFLSSYPMSPSTNVMIFLSQQAEKFKIIVEQAEDEISAVNMALGAWYGGARAMVTTSGGGFDLMAEGISLAGITETPVVIHLGQRPGPATGLPTRTEQGDLDLAIHAGHGDFPRIIFSPGNLEDAFYLTQQAFNLADKFQVPVIILTDQYFLDSYYNIPPFDLKRIKNTGYSVKTGKNYKRYKITPEGISPRGIPGFGDGLVLVDSDEHDENGHITEDGNVRINMVKKRSAKLDLIKKEVIKPELFGPKKYKNLIIGWGSSCSIIKEALVKMNRKDTSFLYFKQVYPFYQGTLNYIKKAKKVITIEQNVSGQFNRLIKLETGVDIKLKILKYNGSPFSVEEVSKEILKII